MNYDYSDHKNNNFHKIEKNDNKDKPRNKYYLRSSNKYGINCRNSDDFNMKISHIKCKLDDIDYGIYY